MKPCDAMIVTPDSQNQTSWTSKDRPPLLITTKGRLALVPSLDELLSRKGAKGLQACLVELGHHHFMKHGYDWIYAGGTVIPFVSRRGQYFIHFAGDTHYVGSHRQAISFLLDYASTGRPDHNRRAR